VRLSLKTDSRGPEKTKISEGEQYWKQSQW